MSNPNNAATYSSKKQKNAETYYRYSNKYVHYYYDEKYEGDDETVQE